MSVLSRSAISAAIVGIIIASGAAHAQTRTVTDVSGTQVEIPENPQRIVVAWDRGITALFAAADIKPVGVASPHEFAPHLVEALDGLEGVANIGSHREPDIEAIAALEPDLIVIQSVERAGSSVLLDRASQIAPTVQLDSSKGLREAIDDFGQIMGDDVAGTLHAQVDAAVAQMAEAVADPSELEVSVGMLLEQGVRLYLDNSTVAAQLIKEAGYDRPDSQLSGTDEIYNNGTEVSLEEIFRLEGDMLFLSPRIEGGLEGAMELNLLSALPVVAEERVVEFDWRYWNVGGPLAAGMIADDFVEGLRSVGLAD